MKKKKIDRTKERELVGNSLHLFNTWDQFFDAYSKDLGRLMNAKDRSSFEMYRKNTKGLMEDLKKHLENMDKEG